MNAQSFSFVDGNGNVIENGTTLTMDKISYMDDIEIHPDGSYDLVKVPIAPLSGVYIKNNSSQDASCDVTFTMEKYLEGCSFQTCCGGTCVQMPGDANLSAIDKTLNIGGGKSFDISNQTEMKFGVNTLGTCTVKISIKGKSSLTTDSEITVNFVYSGSTSVNGIHNDVNNKVVARYSIDGQLLNAPQKGINILKYADGRTEKVIVK